MSEIKFRGQRIDNKEWIYGDLFSCMDSEKTYIRSFYSISPCQSEPAGNNYQEDIAIIPETVGQYTGLKAENSSGIIQEIFSGDIVSINNKNYLIVYELGAFGLARISKKTDMYEEFKIYWNDDICPLIQFYWDSNSEEGYVNNITIIGNKFDNPELLEEK
jgi:uncharacterized phage protein (TIGR01671 family)